MTQDFNVTTTPAGHTRLEFPPGIVVDLDRAKRSVAAIEAVADSPYRLLVALTGLNQVDAESRSYLAGLTGPKAVAISISSVIDGASVRNVAARIIANTFISAGRSNYPTRVFTDEQDAEGWLSQQP